MCLWYPLGLPSSFLHLRYHGALIPLSHLYNENRGTSREFQRYQWREHLNCGRSVL